MRVLGILFELLAVEILAAAFLALNPLFYMGECPDTLSALLLYNHSSPADRPYVSLQQQHPWE